MVGGAKVNGSVPFVKPVMESLLLQLYKLLPGSLQIKQDLCSGCLCVLSKSRIHSIEYTVFLNTGS